MTTPFRDCAELVTQLRVRLDALRNACQLLKLPPLEGREWFELLEHKLLPQLEDDAYLIVAVVGGTNIGKSVIFNHIAGSIASSTSPLASGTKHPVCLIPPGFESDHNLKTIFRGFEPCHWPTPDAALADSPTHKLFWQECEKTPRNLLVLDTPDIDSDAAVNWHRADMIRHAADVLIAVLTQQKYNDAAVKQFFRKAAAEDKAVIVIFNQCQLPEDEAFWPLWLETFSRETGCRPEFVYVAPTDRLAAEETRLPFFARPLRQNDDTAIANSVHEIAGQPRNLTDDLSRLRFDEIKLRTLRGSLAHLVDSETGVPAYLYEVERRSSDFLSAAARLSSESVVKVRDWPSLPNRLLVAEVRSWWKTRQEGWAKRVHSFYDTLGNGISWPIRFARDRLRQEQRPPLEVYRDHEWSVVLRTVEEVFEKLSWMSESGSKLLQPHFDKLLTGKSREELLHHLKQCHDASLLDVELEEVVASEMTEFQTDSPELYRFYRQLNQLSAAVRPVASVVLFTMGWGPGGELVAPFLANAAAHTLVPIVADFAGGTAAAVAGESAVTTAAGTSAGFLQAKFRKLQTAFTARRAEWLVKYLGAHLLGSLPRQLQAAAEIPQSSEYLEVERLVSQLQERLKEF